MIAYLGTGLLGAGFVQAMLKKEMEVQVWNRTPEKATALEQYGAKAFADLVEAVEGANMIHITLKDDDSVDEVLENAAAGFAPGVMIIDHTTTSQAGAIKRTKYWKDKGFTYQHAPVFMGPKNALDSTGFMLISGDAVVASELMPHLSKLTGKVLNFGTEVGKAAAMKLIGNLFLISFTAGLADVLSLANAQGVELHELLDLFKDFNPAAASIPHRLNLMHKGDFSHPTWELNMARKDTQLFLNAVDKAGEQLLVIPAIAAKMDGFIAEGHGGEDWMIIGKK